MSLAPPVWEKQAATRGMDHVAVKAFLSVSSLISRTIECRTVLFDTVNEYLDFNKDQ